MKQAGRSRLDRSDVDPWPHATGSRCHTSMALLPTAQRESYLRYLLTASLGLSSTLACGSESGDAPEQPGGGASARAGASSAGTGGVAGTAQTGGSSAGSDSPSGVAGAPAGGMGGDTSVGGGGTSGNPGVDGSTGGSGAAGTAGSSGNPPVGGSTIINDRFWKDSSGTPIYSQGGGVLQVGDTYYWYGVKYAGTVAYAANPVDNDDTLSRALRPTPRKTW